MEHMEGRIGNVIVDGLDEKIQNSYSMNQIIQMALTDKELSLYFAAVEGYSERAFEKSYCFAVDTVLLFDAAYVLAAKKHNRPSMKQYLDEVRIRVQAVEQAWNTDLKEVVDALVVLEREDATPTLQYSIDLTEEHSVDVGITILKTHLAFLKKAEKQFDTLYDFFGGTLEWQFLSKFSLLGKAYARIMPVVNDVLESPDHIVYDTLRRALEKDPSIECNENCKKALEILSEGAIWERFCYVVDGEASNVIPYDVVEAAQETYKAGAKAVFDGLVKAKIFNSFDADVFLKMVMENWDVETFIGDVLFDHVADKTIRAMQNDGRMKK